MNHCTSGFGGGGVPAFDSSRSEARAASTSGLASFRPTPLRGRALAGADDSLVPCRLARHAPKRRFERLRVISLPNIPRAPFDSPPAPGLAVRLSRTSESHRNTSPTLVGRMVTSRGSNWPTTFVSAPECSKLTAASRLSTCGPERVYSVPKRCSASAAATQAASRLRSPEGSPDAPVNMFLMNRPRAARRPGEASLATSGRACAESTAASDDGSALPS